MVQLWDHAECQQGSCLNPLRRLHLSKSNAESEQCSQIPTGLSLFNTKIIVVNCFLLFFFFFFPFIFIFCPGPGLKSFSPSLRAAWWRTTARDQPRSSWWSTPSSETSPTRGRSASSSRTTSTGLKRSEARKVSGGAALWAVTDFCVSLEIPRVDQGLSVQEKDVGSRRKVKRARLLAVSVWVSLTQVAKFLPRKVELSMHCPFVWILLLQF